MRGGAVHVLCCAVRFTKPVARMEEGTEITLSRTARKEEQPKAAAETGPEKVRAQP